MTKLLPILFMSILLSAELEVDGNLKVTGTVESTTIDSLKAVIADLQAQLAALNGYSTCLLLNGENNSLCVQGLSEPDCYQYHGFDTLQINIEFPTWSSTSSCDSLGYNENFTICNDSFQPLLDASHCSYNWYCSGDCESLLEENEELTPGASGCMLVDAPNYDPSAILPCTTDCINGQTGANCCCEEIIYGCMFTGAINYSETANAPCIEIINGVETPNACCIYETIGCMDQGAINYNPDANVDDGSCEYDNDGDSGCMNVEACNFNAIVTADCNGDNPENSGAEWVQNDDCCDLTYYTTCYLDLNNNGFYEEILDSISMCDCGELGVGWVNEDAVNGLEVQGCTQPIVDGQPCPEYNPQANVDNGSCCLQ